MASGTSVAAPDFYARLREQLIKAVVGQEEAIRLCAIALVAQGHVLLEGVPGTGKTLLAKSLAPQGAGGAAGGDGGARGYPRGPAAGAAGALHRPRDAEPGRVRGHLPIAGGAAGSVPLQGASRLPVACGRDGGPAPLGVGHRAARPGQGRRRASAGGG